MGGWGEGEDCRGDEWEGGGRGRIAEVMSGRVG